MLYLFSLLLPPIPFTSFNSLYFLPSLLIPIHLTFGSTCYQQLLAISPISCQLLPHLTFKFRLHNRENARKGDPSYPPRPTLHIHANKVRTLSLSPANSARQIIYTPSPGVVGSVGAATHSRSPPLLFTATSSLPFRCPGLGFERYDPLFSRPLDVLCYIVKALRHTQTQASFLLYSRRLHFFFFMAGFCSGGSWMPRRNLELPFLGFAEAPDALFPKISFT